MSRLEGVSGWKDTKSITDDNLSIVCLAPDSPTFSVAPLSSEPVDVFAELESISDQMRTFISDVNCQHNRNDKCLEIACKDEQIEDAVYALGNIFYLNFKGPRGSRYVRFTLPIGAPTVVDEDEVRQIIYGDLLRTPIRVLMKKLRAWIADPNGPESIRVQKVARIRQLCRQFKLNVIDEKDELLLTKSKKLKGAPTLINEKNVEKVLREKRKRAVKAEKQLFLKTHRAAAPIEAQGVIEDSLLHSFTNELRSFVADTDGPRSMTISKSAFSPEVSQLAAMFSLAVTPESDAIILTKKTQGPFVVSETKVAEVINKNGKRVREEDNEDAEVPPDSPLSSDEQDPGPDTGESQTETRNLEQEIRKFVVDAHGPTSMTLYCPDNAKNLTVFLLAHAFGLIFSETPGPGSCYVQLTRTANTTIQNIDEASVKRLLIESHPSFRAAQLILEGGPDCRQISDIKGFEQCLHAFIDDAEAKIFSIPYTSDPRVTALANVFRLDVKRNGDQMTVRRRLKGGLTINEKKLAKALRMSVDEPKRKRRRKTTISAPSSSDSAEQFPNIEVPALSLWLRAFLNNAQGPLEMTIPPTSQRTQEDVTQLAAAFGLDAAFNNGFTSLKKTGRGR
ncbi:hypothetical protein EDD18DRAFT_1174590 [Armillaria luteobubalina]|uniref:Uncharacterized protein n=1 Tax=Armillaria luteobubalina TaxID=153913 RepID=A0AA39URQ5_9AGAR|nr:hypothetical protein EDD18DRAFT_1174590 [Armillaria luteobubalina]